jgi:hypothetical protein
MQSGLNSFNLFSTKNENQEDFKNALNLAFAQIPYDLRQKENEHFYHAIVIFYLVY